MGDKLQPFFHRKFVYHILQVLILALYLAQNTVSDRDSQLASCNRFWEYLQSSPMGHPALGSIDLRLGDSLVPPIATFPRCRAPKPNPCCGSSLSKACQAWAHFQTSETQLMALLPQTPPPVGPHSSPSGLHLPDIDDDEPLVELLRQLSE